MKNAIKNGLHAKCELSIQIYWKSGNNEQVTEGFPEFYSIKYERYNTAWVVSMYLKQRIISRKDLEETFAGSNIN